jgi:naphthalene 1,2-dioxygenase system ferredoxin subunit
MTDTTPTWSDVAALADLWDGAGMEVRAEGHALALFRVGDEVFATAPMCTHCAPAYEALQTWPVRIEGGRVYVALS